MKIKNLKILDWKLPFIIGIFLAVGMWKTWRFFEPPMNAEEEIMTKAGYDLSSFRHLRPVREKVDFDRDITENDWRYIIDVYRNKDLNSATRMYSFYIMNCLGKTSHRDEILKIAKSELKNTAWEWRDNAIYLLYVFKDPDWIPEATKGLNDPNERIRQGSKYILWKASHAAPKRQTLEKP